MLTNRVREARARRRVSQARLAELADTSRQTVISIERGGSVPSVDLALRLARALDETVDDLFRLPSADAPRRPLLVAGSDDPGLALLAERLRPEGVLLSLSPLGSSAGLESLRRGEADLAGIHLDDNARRAKAAVPTAALVRFARREQGLVLRRPKLVARVQDLGDLRLVLRPLGSGTRLLFDRLVPARPRRIVAEVATHAEVAAAILRGEADAGTATRATALRYGLHFFSLAWERFDLALPRALLEDPRLRALRETLARAEHRRAIEALGGYDLADAGDVVA